MLGDRWVGINFQHKASPAFLNVVVHWRCRAQRLAGSAIVAITKSTPCPRRDPSWFNVSPSLLW